MKFNQNILATPSLDQNKIIQGSVPPFKPGAEKLPPADMSSSEFSFKLFAGIIHDRARETLVPVIRGESRCRSIVRSIFLDRGA